MRFDKMTSDAVELCKLFRVKFGPADAENEMARELLELNQLITNLEQRIVYLERDRHRAYHREKPRQPIALFKFEEDNPVETDEWIVTGRETA